MDTERARVVAGHLNAGCLDRSPTGTELVLSFVLEAADTINQLCDELAAPVPDEAGDVASPQSDAVAAMALLVKTMEIVGNNSDQRAQLLEGIQQLVDVVALAK